MKQILLFLFILIGFPAISQTTESLVLRVGPVDAFVKIDTIFLETTPSEIFNLNLASGEHIIEIWAPEFELFRDTILIKEGRPNRYSKGLQHKSPEFQLYLEELDEYKEYKSNVLLYKAGSYTASAMVLAGGVVQILRTKNKAEIEREDYLAGFDHEKILQHKEAYNKYKRQNAGWKIFLGVALPATYFLHKAAQKYTVNNKKETPVFDKSGMKNPLANIDIFISSNQFGGTSLTLIKTF